MKQIKIVNFEHWKDCFLVELIELVELVNWLIGEVLIVLKNKILRILWWSVYCTHIQVLTILYLSFALPFIILSLIYNINQVFILKYYCSNLLNLTSRELVQFLFGNVFVCYIQLLVAMKVGHIYCKCWLQHVSKER